MHEVRIEIPSSPEVELAFQYIKPRSLPRQRVYDEALKRLRFQLQSRFMASEEYGKPPQRVDLHHVGENISLSLWFDDPKAAMLCKLVHA